MTARLFTFEPCKIEAGDQSNVYVIFLLLAGRRSASSDGILLEANKKLSYCKDGTRIAKN